jgi:uncharacterized protein
VFTFRDDPMKKIILILICFSSFTFANEVRHHELSLELYKVLEVQNKMDLYSKMLEKKTYQQFPKEKFPKAVEPLVKEYIKNINSLFYKSFSSQQFKKDVVAIYIEVFTENEIKELIKFLSTATGKKLIDNQPALMGSVSTVAQKYISELKPEIQVYQEALMREFDKIVKN